MSETMRIEDSLHAYAEGERIEVADEEVLVDRFTQLLAIASRELFDEDPTRMGSPDLRPTTNEISPSDLELFFRGVDAGLIKIDRAGRFNTLDRPKPGGRWSLLSRSTEGGWYNAEYLPQLAAYVDAVLGLGFHPHRVLFELPASALQLDLAIVDDSGEVFVLAEAKRDNHMLDKLLLDITNRFGERAPDDDSKKRGDEARQLAWRLWTARPPWLWLIGPGRRSAYLCSFDAGLRLDPHPSLPTATEAGITAAPTTLLPPPQLL